MGISDLVSGGLSGLSSTFTDTWKAAQELRPLSDKQKEIVNAEKVRRQIDYHTQPFRSPTLTEIGTFMGAYAGGSLLKSGLGLPSTFSMGKILTGKFPAYTPTPLKVPNLIASGILAVATLNSFKDLVMGPEKKH